MLILSWVALSAQIVRDFRPYRSVVTHLIADQTITARKYQISFATAGNMTPEGLAQQAMISASESALIDGATTISGLSSSELFSALGPVLGPIGAISMAYNFAAFYGSISNTQSRSFQFYLPVRGLYVISCRLKGDWDRPNNKVKMIGPNGIVIDYQEERSSDTSHIFGLILEPGSYALNVSLGSGSSSVFHTAGYLESVLLDDYTFNTWTAPVVVTGYRHALPAAVGDQASLQVTFSGYPATVPGLLDGRVSYANLRPAPQAILGSLDGTALGTVRAVNKPIEVIEPVIVTTGIPTFNGTTAIFMIQRVADLDWVEYPDDWYDQDGDGIPDPPAP